MLVVVFLNEGGIVRVAFGLLRDGLALSSVYFTTTGVSRLSDSDLVSFVDGVGIEPFCAFLAGRNLFEMGSFSYSWSQLPVDFSVGRYCSIARGLKVLGVRHPLEWVTTSSFTYDDKFVIFDEFRKRNDSAYSVRTRPRVDSGVVIGDDVWIGADVTLKPGLKIGRGAVIAASSVVVKDVEPYSVVGGNPARFIRWRFDPSVIDRLLGSRWWMYRFSDFDGLDVSNPMAFCDGLERLISRGDICQFLPQKHILSGGV